MQFAKTERKKLAGGVLLGRSLLLAFNEIEVCNEIKNKMSENQSPVLAMQLLFFISFTSRVTQAHVDVELAQPSSPIAGFFINILLKKHVTPKHHIELKQNNSKFDFNKETVSLRRNQCKKEKEKETYVCSFSKDLTSF